MPLTKDPGKESKIARIMETSMDRRFHALSSVSALFAILGGRCSMTSVWQVRESSDR